MFLVALALRALPALHYGYSGVPVKDVQEAVATQAEDVIGSERLPHTTPRDIRVSTAAPACSSSTACRGSGISTMESGPVR